MNERGKSARRLIHRVLERRLWGDTPLFLLDVGASGGIETRWTVFGDRLKAIGFDPLVSEVDRLNAANQQPGIQYVAALVGVAGYDELFPPAVRSDRVGSRNNDPWSRVSAAAAQTQRDQSYVQLVFNSGAPLVVTDRRVALDDVV